MDKKISLFIILLISLFMLIGSVSAESIVSSSEPNIISNNNINFVNGLEYNDLICDYNNTNNSTNFNYIILSSQENNQIYIENESFYNKTNLNEDIQSVLDNASENSTIEFLGLNYTNLHLIINKPLNILGSNTTITSSLDVPVFTISSYASGTKISGFNIVSSKSTAIYANGVSDLLISDNIIKSNSSDGINIINSKNVSLLNNNIKSSKIGVLLSNSEGINILKNNISGINNKGITGIKLINCAGLKSVIKFNNISYYNIGINSSNDVKNIVINSNKITHCINGIFLNSGINMTIENNTMESNDGDSFVLNGKSDNLIIKSNIFSKNGGGGFVIGDSYDFSSNKGLKLYANYFSKNKDFDIQSNGYDLAIDYNIANHICPRVNMKNYSLRAFNDGNTYGISIYTADGQLANDLPTFSTIINTNNGYQNVTFINGKAQFDLDFSKDAYLELTFGTKVYRGSINEILNKLTNNQGIEKISTDYDVNNNSRREYSNVSNSSGTLSNSSTFGNYYVSSQGAASGGVNPSSASGPKSASSSSPLLTYLTVDDEIYKVSGVAGLLILIIIVICGYYSRDIYDMLKK